MSTDAEYTAAYATLKQAETAVTIAEEAETAARAKHEEETQRHPHPLQISRRYAAIQYARAQQAHTDAIARRDAARIALEVAGKSSRPNDNSTSR